MAKFKFRLQGYFDIKQKLEDKAKQDYGMAMVILERERRERARLENERQTKLEEFRDSLSVRIKPSELQGFNNYIEVLKKGIVQQNERVKKAKELTEIRRAALSEAMKQRKMLEKLHDNAKTEFVKESIKAEQKEVEELTNYKFLR
ncbi:MAG: flagellar export protein FliJ [Defluviitaleaceae bacterium]|nr:flagellar export protein FliJ [Defluviitaleaceae bacterium]